MIRNFLLIACITATLPISQARAEEPAVTRVEFGVGGAYKPAAWTPIVAEVEGVPADSGVILETLTSDADGCTVLQSIASADASSKTFHGVIQAGRLGSDVTLRV